MYFLFFLFFAEVSSVSYIFVESAMLRTLKKEEIDYEKVFDSVCGGILPGLGCS